MATPTKAQQIAHTIVIEARAEQLGLGSTLNHYYAKLSHGFVIFATDPDIAGFWYKVRGASVIGTVSL